MTTHGVAIQARRAVSGAEARERPGWAALYRIGGWAAVAMLALIPVQLAVFVIWPLPTTVAGWFALFQSNWLIGLIDMDVLLIVDWALTVLIFLALAIAVRRTGPALLVIAVTFELVAAATYFASAGAVEMLALSGRFATAATDAERTVLLAAGETVVAAWTGTSFVVATVLSAIAILVLSTVMLRGRVFGRTIPILGLAMGATAIVPPNAGTIGLMFSLLYLLPFVVWLVLVARALLRFSEHAEDLPGDPAQ